MKNQLRWIGPLVLATLLAGPASVAEGQASDERAKPPGEGVMCALAIYSAMDQVGRVCFPGQDPAMQAEVGRAVAKLDRYVLANGWTAEDLAHFKREQASVDTPKDKLCKGDFLDLYKAAKTSDPAALGAAVDKATSRPGQPTWGTCL
jgi:hypothetical protein